MKKFGYPKAEKLKQKKEISLLFEKGKWQTCGNLRIIFLKENLSENLQFGVSVSKRFYKKAADRNRIKRLLREAFRLNKTEFKKAFGENSSAMLFYISPTKPKHFSEIEDNFLKLCIAKKKS
ncbi:ribonuclease P protein component [Halpernia humi]|uniref:Ribonuclease P protein component n=1 Tax=Halpernia humi TaxID=493375 RepID=A0A1H5WSV8_9FLAO|nr:ribonuclease P protein component [Halpernia humi]SEG02572.1 ribonuclease P protein component [Halpernia humi]